MKKKSRKLLIEKNKNSTIFRKRIKKFFKIQFHWLCFMSVLSGFYIVANDTCGDSFKSEIKGKIWGSFFSYFFYRQVWRISTHSISFHFIFHIIFFLYSLINNTGEESLRVDVGKIYYLMFWLAVSSKNWKTKTFNFSHCFSFAFDSCWRNFRNIFGKENPTRIVWKSHTQIHEQILAIIFNSSRSYSNFFQIIILLLQKHVQLGFVGNFDVIF